MSFSDIDDCAGPGIRCLNGGTCVDGVGSFLCKCKPGTGGRHCEMGKFLKNVKTNAFRQSSQTRTC